MLWTIFARYFSKYFSKLLFSTATTFFGLGFAVACILHERSQPRVIQRVFDVYPSGEVVVARGELLRRALAEVMTGKDDEVALFFIGSVC